jgi:1,4-alpha-glucan branching enzyme
VADGFEWIDHSDAAHSVFSFIRRGTDAASFIVVVCNFTPTVQQGYRVGVPQGGQYRERLNTDSVRYGGSNQGTPQGTATAEPKAWHGKPYSMALTLPPLATVLLEWKR